MRKSHTPIFIKNLIRRVNQFYIDHYIVPQFDSVGDGMAILNPRSVNIFGYKIHGGKNLHIISSTSKPVNLSTWSSKQAQGSIRIGDNVLISPGTSISSALDISIGNNCMFAAESYISDCDWHGIYNRTRPFRCSAKITIKDNAWIGYRAIINKGVTIGLNSVVAAGSVVVEDVPDNCIVGGNPAKVIKTINPKRRMLTREFLFSGSVDYQQNQIDLEYFLNAGNSSIDWLRASLFPNKND